MRECEEVRGCDFRIYCKDTEKMMMTNIIENFVADNIVFGTEVLAHHPEELPLEIWEFTNFHWVL